MKWLVTAGPTVEPIDPVRFISNRSSGKMGYAIAEEMTKRGHRVVLVSGPTGLEVPSGVECVQVESAADMYEVCMRLWAGMDGAVMCAAVADYTPEMVSVGKIKKGNGLVLRLVPTRDIAAEMGRVKRPGQMLVGFALETDREEENARGKMERKNMDMIVLNSLRDTGAGFGVDTNKVTIISPANTTTHPLLSKRECAGVIVDAIEACPKSE